MTIDEKNRNIKGCPEMDETESLQAFRLRVVRWSKSCDVPYYQVISYLVNHGFEARPALKRKAEENVDAEDELEDGYTDASKAQMRGTDGRLHNRSISEQVVAMKTLILRFFNDMEAPVPNAGPSEAKRWATLARMSRAANESFGDFTKRYKEQLKIVKLGDPDLDEATQINSFWAGLSAS